MSWTKKYKTSIDCNNPKGFSQKAHCAGRKARQAGKTTKSKSVSEMTIEEKLNLFLEKNCPTDKAKWASSKAAAKSKFDVYPSAYANGWAAKNYKSKGGGWRKCNESVLEEESKSIAQRIRKINDRISKLKSAMNKVKYQSEKDRIQKSLANALQSLSNIKKDLGVKPLKEGGCWEGYKQVGMKDKNGKQVPNCVPIKEEICTDCGQTQELNCDENGNCWEMDPPRYQSTSMGYREMNEETPVNPAAGQPGGFYGDTAGMEEDDVEEYDVENEQDVKEFVKFMREYNNMLAEANCPCVYEAEYQGRNVKLGKPMQGDVKKFKVYVKNASGNVVKVNFGDPNMRIKKSNPERRKSFRARHNCDNPGPRWKARYWSCRKW